MVKAGGRVKAAGRGGGGCGRAGKRTLATAAAASQWKPPQCRRRPTGEPLAGAVQVPHPIVLDESGEGRECGCTPRMNGRRGGAG